MLKKTITFNNFNDEEVTRDYYFHLSKAELAKLELSKKGGLQAHLQAMIDAEDGAQIVEQLETFIRLSYGKRSADGNNFIQTTEVWEEFRSSPAYEKMFMDLILNTDAQIEFVNGIMPKDLQEQVQRIGGQTKQEAAASIAERGMPERQQNRGQVRPVPDPEPQAAESLADTEPHMHSEGEGPEVENVFSADNPKVLTPAEVVDMDGEELKRGIAEGRYKLQ